MQAAVAAQAADSRLAVALCFTPVNNPLVPSLQAAAEETMNAERGRAVNHTPPAIGSNQVAVSPTTLYQAYHGFPLPALVKAPVATPPIQQQQFVYQQAVVPDPYSQQPRQFVYQQGVPDLYLHPQQLQYGVPAFAASVQQPVASQQPLSAPAGYGSATDEEVDVDDLLALCGITA